MRKVASFILFAIFNCSFAEEPLRADFKELLQANPADVLALRNAVSAMQDAKHEPLDALPPALADTTEINLTVNEEVPVVYLAYLNPTTVDFVDATGAPWPIAETEAFNGGFIDIKPVKNGLFNSMWVNPKATKGRAVVTVYLKGLQTPISYVAEADKTSYHRAKTIKVNKIGPNAIVDKVSSMIAVEEGQANDDDLISAAYGIRPVDYKSLTTNNESVVAWGNSNAILIYTNLDPITPNPIRVHEGQNGWRSYRLPITSRIQFSNKTGSVVEVILGGYNDRKK